MRLRDPFAATAVDDDDIPSNPSIRPTIGDVIARRYRRREVLKGTLGVTAIAAAAGPLALLVGRGAGAAKSISVTVDSARFGFEEIRHGVDQTHHVAPGYDARVLIRWGDPVVAGAPPFDPHNQTAAAQRRQFGYNNDYIGYVGLPVGSDNPDHGLLCVNHEYTNTEVMFPGIGSLSKDERLRAVTRERVDIEMAAHGNSIIEVRRDDGRWRVVKDGRYNRRITAGDTAMRLSGPVAGTARVRTGADPQGTRVIGTINNCAGGITPWGTYLTAEENFHYYFQGDLEALEEKRNFERYGIPGKGYAWGRFHDRFDISKEPREANRFGWIVEIDPFDPNSEPVKRTALGRFKHEGAESIVNTDGRVVVYMGDDQRFDYLYKFVSDGRVDAKDRQANRNLLDAGTLYAARFNDDGSMTWLPLVFGSAPLTAENGFDSQADVLIETRRAADLLGATPMDRPEDVEANAATGKVYVMLTNNRERAPEQRDAANPRADNAFGHIIELSPPDGDHAALVHGWDILVKCGDPSVAEVGALWNPKTGANGWFASPDNCAVDGLGRLWVATDQGRAWSKSGTADGVWALETEGALRGTGRMFFRAPVGAEICGPKFTPDNETLFVAVQHPSTDGAEDFPGFERHSSFEDPATRWPDFQDGMPPRPSVVVITRTGGGVIAMPTQRTP